jgi:hypothetical protein
MRPLSAFVNERIVPRAREMQLLGDCRKCGFLGALPVRAISPDRPIRRSRPGTPTVRGCLYRFGQARPRTRPMIDGNEGAATIVAA